MGILSLLGIDQRFFTRLVAAAPWQPWEPSMEARPIRRAAEAAIAQATAQPSTARRSAAVLVVDRLWHFSWSLRTADDEIIRLIGPLPRSSANHCIATRVPALEGFFDR